MDDIIASVRGHINERLNSPLFGAYALAWLFFNFKVPLMLFSSLDVHQKMYQIDMYLHADFDRVLHVYGWPLVIAAFYIFILPIPSTLVTAWTLFHQNVLASVQQKVLKRRIVTAEELAEKEKQWRDTHDAREKLLQELEVKNEALRSHRARVEAEHNDTLVQLKNAVELGSAIPELNQKISSSSEQITSMTSEVAELKREIQDRRIGDDLIDNILANFAYLADKAGLGKQMHACLAQATSHYSQIPEPIEKLIKSVTEYNDASSQRPNELLDSPEPEPDDPALGIFRSSWATGVGSQNYISDREVFQFLVRYRDWKGGKNQISESSVNRVKMLYKVLSNSSLNYLYSIVKSEASDFSEIPTELDKGLTDIIGM